MVGGADDSQAGGGTSARNGGLFVYIYVQLWRLLLVPWLGGWGRGFCMFSLVGAKEGRFLLGVFPSVRAVYGP